MQQPHRICTTSRGLWLPVFDERAPQQLVRRVSRPAILTRRRSAADAAAPVPFDDVLFLENNQGAGGSTSFVDATGGRTLTALGDAQIDTSEFIFGDSSAQFDGNGDGVFFSSEISLANSVRWALEVWVCPRLASYTGGTDSLRGLTLRANSGGSSALEEIYYHDTDSQNRRVFGTLSGNKDVLTRIETNFAAATWYYLLFQNDPTPAELRVYIGTTPGSTPTLSYTGASKGLRLGTYGYSVAASTDYMDGRIGPIRVTQDYDVPLVVPSGLFPES